MQQTLARRSIRMDDTLTLPFHSLWQPLTSVPFPHTTQAQSVTLLSPYTPLRCPHLICGIVFIKQTYTIEVTSDFRNPYIRRIVVLYLFCEYPAFPLIVFTHQALFACLYRGFVKVLNRKATEFDTWAKSWQGPLGLAP